MDIGHGNAVGVEGEAANLDVLADDQDHLLLLLLHGATVAEGQSHQGVQISGLLLGDHGGHALDEVHELLVLAHEVGLGVDLDHHAHAVDDGGIGHALGGDAAGLLLRGGQALLAEDLHGLVHIALGLGEGLLAVHHAHAGHLAQGLYVFRGDCHNHITSISKLKKERLARAGGRSMVSQFSVDYSAAGSSAFSAAASAASWPCLPSWMALAITPEISLMARMASSLPGIT